MMNQIAIALGINRHQGFCSPYTDDVRQDDTIFGEVGEAPWFNWAISEVLKAWGLQKHTPKFFCADGYVILALLCNAAAKFIDDSFYDYKSMLIWKAINDHNSCWKDEGVVYFETSVGQISFHVFEDEDELLPAANGRQWLGGWMQDRCVEIAMAFLNGGADGEEEYIFSEWLDSVQRSRDLGG